MGSQKSSLFFRMFKPRQAPATTPVQPPAIEVVRQRAKHRLIGASVLVLAGVLVFPVLFDTQPRPIPVDIPIEIPSRQSAPPLGKVTLPAPATASVASPVGTDASLGPSEAVVTAPAPTKAPAPALPATPAPKANAARADAAEATRALALLEGKTPEAAEPQKERFIVQAGAFSDATLAQQTRLKLERAGLKTYTHVANTADGKRTRVRLGPFATRAEAEKAAAKAKGLGISAAILSL